ncbi:MAG: choice-of-anchor Q domain-containing protein [Segetibacter sp.]
MFPTPLLQGGCPDDATCTNVLDQDPLFVSDADLHLQACSPAIDTGSDAAKATTTDLDGKARKVDAITGGSQIDMGAYEYQQVLPTFYHDYDGDTYGNGRRHGTGLCCTDRLCNKQHGLQR